VESEFYILSFYLRKILVTLALVVVLPSTANCWTKKVSISLGDVKGGKGFDIDVEVKLADGWEGFSSQRIDSNSWEKNIPPGEYRLRTRTIDGRGVPGAWGEYNEFSIDFPKIGLLRPKADSVLQVKSGKTKKTRFRWDNIQGHSGYILQVRDESSGVVKSYKTKRFAMTRKLRVGRDYSYRVLFVSGQDPQDTQIPWSSFSIKLAPLATPTISFEKKSRIAWERVRAAKSYDVQLERTLPQQAGDDAIEWEVVFANKSYKQKNIRLKKYRRSGARYRLSVKAVAPNRTSSQALIHEFDFNKVISQNTLFAVRGDKDWEFTYGYVPMLQMYHVTKNALESDVAVFATNSNFVSLRYWFGGAEKNFGLDLYYYRARNTLFEEGNSEVVTDGSQEPIDLSNNVMALKGIYPFYRSWFSLSLEAGAQIKNFYTFGEGDVGRVVSEENITQEVMGGLHIYYPYAGWMDMDLGAIYGYHFGTYPSEVSDSDHLVLYGDLAHSILMPDLLLSYRYTYDYTRNVFTDSLTGATGQEAVIKSYQLGITGTFIF